MDAEERVREAEAKAKEAKKEVREAKEEVRGAKEEVREAQAKVEKALRTDDEEQIERAQRSLQHAERGLGIAQDALNNANATLKAREDRVTRLQEWADTLASRASGTMSSQVCFCQPVQPLPLSPVSLSVLFFVLSSHFPHFTLFGSSHCPLSLWPPLRVLS